MPACHPSAADRISDALAYHAEEGSEVGSELALHAICKPRCHDVRWWAVPEIAMGVAGIPDTVPHTVEPQKQV